MKKGVITVTGLAMLFSLCVASVAAQSSRAVETRVVDTFDNNGEYEWTWNVKYSAGMDTDNGFPKYGFFPGQPNSLRVLNASPDETHNVFGVKTSYKRKGENWFEVYPEKDGKPYEIPLVGTVTLFDFWMWGANYLYYVDILIRDAEGRVHSLPAGNLLFEGWKNIVISVPTYIPQHARMRTGPKNILFIGFRIRTDVSEFVDDFNIFFDQLKFTTNTLSNIFDGYELRDLDFGDSSKEGK